MGLALALIIAGILVWLATAFSGHVIVGIILVVIGLVLLINGAGIGGRGRRVWY